MLLPGTGPSRVHLIVYISVQVILTALTITSLALHEWFKYCFWDFGLVYAHSFYPSVQEVYADTTIADVRSDWCDQDTGVDDYCPEFCTYVSGFQSAGGFMVFIGVVTILSALTTVALHALALAGRPLKHWLVWVWLSLPGAIWLLGTIIYGGVTNLAGVETVHRTKVLRPKDAEARSGLILCAVLVVLQGFLLLYALLTTRKAFTRD